MITGIDYGYYRGRAFVQKRGDVGGYRSVFVKLLGVHNELVYPTFGGVIMNPFKGRAKFYAGDLLEFRANDEGVKCVIYLLKTYEVLSASGTVAYIKRDGFRHRPFAGDVLMVAPAEIGGTGTAVAVSFVREGKVEQGGKMHDVWALTLTATLGTLADGTILVEAESTGSDKAMLVKNINAVADCDADMMFNDVADTSSIGAENEDYVDARYLYTPALGGLMYTHKMSPMPQCVLALNRSKVNGWFKLDCYGKADVEKDDTLLYSSEPFGLYTVDGKRLYAKN